ncbi:MAG TPA: hypothetical protein VGL06_18700 [Pseudonocardiaceae bacterium]
MTGSVTRVAVEIDRGAPVPPAADVDTVVAALRGIAAAVRAEREPDDAPELDSPQLAGIASHLRLVVAALRGPSLDRPRPFPLVRRLLPGQRRLT